MVLSSRHVLRMDTAVAMLGTPDLAEVTPFLNGGVKL